VWYFTMRHDVMALLAGVAAVALLCVIAVGHGASRAVRLEVPDGQLEFVVAEPSTQVPPVTLSRPRRMFLYKPAPAPLQTLEETIGPGSLEIDPGREGAGVGGGSDEEGQCFADVTCGASCANCEKCQCLMDDGRTLECKFGQCKCLRQCNCGSTDDCPMACGLDYSPELCGQKHCRAGKCYEAFNLPLEDPEWRMRRAR